MFLVLLEKYIALCLGFGFELLVDYMHIHITYDILE